MKIRGNTVGMSNPRPDWEQESELKANYIKNKPNPLLAPASAKVGDFIRVSAVQDGKVVATDTVSILLQEKTVIPGPEAIEVTPSRGYFGLAKVIVEATTGGGGGGGSSEILTAVKPLRVGKDIRVEATLSVHKPITVGVVTDVEATLSITKLVRIGTVIADIEMEENA